MLVVDWGLARAESSVSWNTYMWLVVPHNMVAGSQGQASERERETETETGTNGSRNFLLRPNFRR